MHGALNDVRVGDDGDLVHVRQFQIRVAAQDVEPVVRELGAAEVGEQVAPIHADHAEDLPGVELPSLHHLPGITVEVVMERAANTRPDLRVLVALERQSMLREILADLLDVRRHDAFGKEEVVRIRILPSLERRAPHGRGAALEIDAWRQREVEVVLAAASWQSRIYLVLREGGDEALREIAVESSDAIQHQRMRTYGTS